MELRERLATLRRERGYSLRELRQRIEDRTGEQMAISYLSALERVGRAPSIEALGRIAAGYEMSLTELLAPTDLSGEIGSISDLPPGLERIVRNRGLSDKDVAELSRIEFRGRRPQTEQEWELILSALNVLPERKDKS